jgi:hypothetical protein
MINDSQMKKETKEREEREEKLEDPSPHRIQSQDMAAHNQDVQEYNMRTMKQKQKRERKKEERKNNGRSLFSE